MNQSPIFSFIESNSHIRRTSNSLSHFKKFASYSFGHGYVRWPSSLRGCNVLSMYLRHWCKFWPVKEWQGAVAGKMNNWHYPWIARNQGNGRLNCTQRWKWFTFCLHRRGYLCSILSHLCLGGETNKHQSPTIQWLTVNTKVPIQEIHCMEQIHHPTPQNGILK